MGLLTKIIIGAVAKKTALKIHENVEEKDKQERSLEEVISSCMFENILIAKDNKTAVINKHGREDIYDLNNNLLFQTKSIRGDVPMIEVYSVSNERLGEIALDIDYYTEEYNSCLYVHYFEKRTRAFRIYGIRKTIDKYVAEFENKEKVFLEK